MEEVELFRSNDDFEVMQVCEILKKNRIEFIRRDEGAGAYLNIVSGTNFGTKKIFVSSEKYEEACELIAMFNKNENAEEVKDNAEDNEYIEKEMLKMQKMRRVLLLWIPLTLILIIVIASIFS